MNLLSALACVASPLWLTCAGASDPFAVDGCTPEKVSMFGSGWPKEFDAHIYWFGMDNEVERATGDKSRFYDPSKPTIIWMDGVNSLYHVHSCRRYTSRCVDLGRCEPGFQYNGNAMVKRGWNFGIFFWDQIADEDCFYTAELKVWGQGPDGLTWKSYDIETQKTETHLYEGPEKSVGALCATAIRTAMPTFSGPSLQINGFSLGSQLATACAEALISTPGHPAAPTLLTLLEPIFTNHDKPWSVRPLHPCYPVGSNDTRALNWTALVVERLFSDHHVPTTIYKSSRMTRCCGSPVNIVFDTGTQLDLLGTLVRWDPTFCKSPLNYGCSHEVIVPFYFNNWGSTQVQSLGPTSGNCTIPSVQCSDAEIYDIVVQRRKSFADGSEHLWKQVEGMDTWTLADDVFRWDTTNDPPAHAPTPAAPLPQLYDLHALGRLASEHSSSLTVVLGLMLLAAAGCVVFRIKARSRLSRRWSRVLLVMYDDEVFSDDEQSKLALHG